MYAKSLFDKALAALEANDAASARKIALRLAKVEKDNFSCWHLLAAIHGKLGEIALAEKASAKAARLAPSDLDRGQVYEQLGKLLMANQLPARATKYFTRLQQLAPGSAEAAYYLAESFRSSRQYRLALAEYDKAITISGAKPEFLIRKADCLQKIGQVDDAISTLTKIPISNPVHVDTVIALVDCYVEANAFAEAERTIQEAINIEPGNAYLHYQMALLYRNIGELDKATSCFEKTLSLAPDAATVYYNYARIRRFDTDDPIVENIQRCLAKLPVANETDSQLKDKTELLFTLGKIAEDSQHYEQAFSYWRKANALKRRTFDYDIATDRKRIVAIKKVFNGNLIDRLQLGASDEPTPIFILGLPRTGSTLCEQILSSHAEVRGLGELTLLPELLGELESDMGLPYPRLLTRIDKRKLQALRDNYLACATGNDRHGFFTDKLPGNFWRVGLIRILFPGAMIIHARRDPIDTGFSCFKHLFSGPQKFAYDLTEIRHYIQLYQELMAYWHELLPGAIFDLSYEDLVTSPENTVKSMLSFCGLPWQQDCLKFYETRRAVRSSSAAQIRRPLHTAAVSFWRHYEQHLHELTDLRQSGQS